MSKTLPSELLGFVRQAADKEVLVGHEDLLDVVGIGHCCRERCRGRGVFYGLGEWAQDAPWHPALGSRRVNVGRPVNQVHVLLVSGQDLDRLTLSDADLVFFECRVAFDDPHGGGDAVTAAVTVLGSGRKMEGGKRTKGRGEETKGKGRSGTERGWGQLRTRLWSSLAGLDHGPDGCNAVAADRHLRRSRGRS